MPVRNLTIIMLAALVSMACYTRASRNRFASTLTDAMNIISADYVDDVEPRKLFEGAMDGMVGQLDPNSGYSPPEELQQFNEQMEQGFVGIGILVEIDPESKRLMIKSPLVGSPAFKAGIRPNDIILSVDDKDTTGMTLRDSTKLIKGPEGTSLTLSILHAGETMPVDIVVEREEIPVESVYGDTRDADGKWIFRLEEKPNIGYIRIHSFAERTVDEVQVALDSYRKPGKGVEGLIVDLRGNSGGLLEAAVKICDKFLDEGVIVTTKGRTQDRSQPPLATPGTEISPDIPMVVLVDKFSASASEIVAACLQDHKRAVVGGQRSYGKGTVQNIIKLEGGRSALRLTVAKYSRPSGKNIHKSMDAKDTDDWGVIPDQGLGINLTNDELETWVKARRQRDLETYTGQSRISVLQANKKSEEPKEAKPSEDEPKPKAISELPSATDPQLRKALDYLQERLLKMGGPRAA